MRSILRYLALIILLYSLLFPFVLLHVFVEVYHQIGFRLCRIPRVDHTRFIIIDRHKLSYLRWWQKINCLYCGYVNGLLGYVSEIAARTEYYWCPIQHKKIPKMHIPKHHKLFAAYNDAEAFRALYQSTKK